MALIALFQTNRLQRSLCFIFNQIWTKRQSGKWVCVVFNIYSSYSIFLTHQPGQPILSHPPICLHVPWVDKYGAAQLFSCLWGEHSARSVFLREWELDLRNQGNVPVVINQWNCKHRLWKWLSPGHYDIICAYNIVWSVSRRKRDRVQWHWGPSCWYVSQSAPQGTPAPWRSASSPWRPNRELALAAFPGPQTSWGGYAQSGPNHRLKWRRDPVCHEVWPVIQ